MRDMLQPIIEGIQRCLDEAKQRCGWGGIGEFYLDYADWPVAAAMHDYPDLREEVHIVFLENGEPGILVQFFPEDKRLRVGVIRTNENV